VRRNPEGPKNGVGFPSGCISMTYDFQTLV